MLAALNSEHHGSLLLSLTMEVGLMSDARFGTSLLMLSGQASGDFYQIWVR
jgi:hypothetical protein